MPNRLQLLAGLAVLAAQACAQSAVSSTAITVNPQPAPFVLTERASLALPFDSGAHGISALAVGPSSDQLLALSDKGRAQLFELDLDEDGTLTGAKSVADRPVTANNHPTDIESAIRLPDGGWLIGLERPHRLAHYATGDLAAFSERPDFWSPPARLSSFSPNRGIEAMALLDDGQVMLISEGKLHGAHRLWIGASGRWSEAIYQTAVGFDPVEAVRHPCGGVMVLERAANAIRGLTARLVYLSEAQVVKAGAGEPVVPADIGPIEPTAGRGNFEGMAIRTAAPSGESCPQEIELMVVTDDNNLPFLPRILAQYRLSDLS